MSIKGVYLGFFLPLRVLAASVAKRPRVLPLASTTNHLRVISCELGKYVDIVTCFSRRTLSLGALCTPQKPRGQHSAFPQTKGSESLEWRRIDLERFHSFFGLTKTARCGFFGGKPRKRLRFGV